MTAFDVTYEIWTEADAEIGETDERGYIAEGVDLRSALEFARETRTAHCSGVEYVEANCWPLDGVRWVTVYNGMEYRTGARECRSLHIPAGVTNASRKRIARLMGCAA